MISNFLPKIFLQELENTNYLCRYNQYFLSTFIFSDRNDASNMFFFLFFYVYIFHEYTGQSIII